MNVEDQDGIARIVIRILEELEIPYMITGSVASFLYGEPRATYDLDIVIAPTRESFQELLEALEPHAYVSREAAMDAFRRRQMFNVIGFETTEKVDFILFKDRPYSTTAFERRQRRSLESLDFVVTTAEDSVLSKLSWARRSGSERQLRDVYGILRNGRATLDWGYLEHWAPELGVSPLLEKLREELKLDLGRDSTQRQRDRKDNT